MAILILPLNPNQMPNPFIAAWDSVMDKFPSSTPMNLIGLEGAGN